MFRLNADKFLFHRGWGVFYIVLVREKSCRMNLEAYQIFKQIRLFFLNIKILRYIVINIPWSFGFIIVRNKNTLFNDYLIISRTLEGEKC